MSHIKIEGPSKQFQHHHKRWCSVSERYLTRHPKSASIFYPLMLDLHGLSIFLNYILYLLKYQIAH